MSNERPDVLLELIEGLYYMWDGPDSAPESGCSYISSGPGLDYLWQWPGSASESGSDSPPEPGLE